MFQRRLVALLITKPGRLTTELGRTDTYTVPITTSRGRKEAPFMLVLTRKVGEEVLIGDKIRLTVVAIMGNRVRLGFTAPADTPILRAELRGPRDPSCEQDPGSPDSPESP